MTHRHAASSLTLLLLVMQVAQAQSFLGLGHLPGTGRSVAAAVSADGSVVVGQSGPDSPWGEAFRWTAATGMVGLGYLPGGTVSHAYDVSADGSVVVGTSFSSSPSEAFRWTAATGLVALGGNPEIIYARSAAGVSSDGSVVVGWGSGSHNPESFRWSSAGGIVSLWREEMSKALDVSADGSTVVGTYRRFDEHDEVWEAAVWTASGFPTPLGDLPGGAFWSCANAVSADGSVVVGESASNVGENTEAFRWTAATGMVGLGAMPGDHRGSCALGVSADGSVVVGRDINGGAFIWDAAHGERSLQDVLVNDYGLDLSGWNLLDATDISPDGKTIVGWGSNAGGFEAFRATIPEPGDANGDGVVGDTDASIVGAHWMNTGARWGDGDFNGDNVVNDRDAAILAAHWSATAPAETPSVPEPTSLAILLGGSLSLLAVRRQSARLLRGVRVRGGKSDSRQI
ncbi:MAG: dockerin type I domain-containing protein [Planctomycetia bacterium]|nr:dockerin type I domain-containing protein [Planctomycetia bacterium]